jgi:signal transduction histidine kinase
VTGDDRCDARRVLVRSARRRLPVIAAAVSLLGWVAAVAFLAATDHRLSQLGRADLYQLGGSGLVFLVASASACLVGAVLLVRRPEHPVGWCFAFLGFSVAASGAAQDYGLLGLVADPRGDHPGAGAAAVLASSLFVLWLITIGLVCHLTPTGHYLSARWARGARLLWIAGLIWFGTVLISPTKLEAPFGDVENPWGIEALRGSPLIAIRSVTGVITGLLVLVAFASLVARFRRSYGEERRQLLWMGIAAVPVPVLVVVTFVAAKADNDVVLNLAAGGFVAVLPLAAGLAVAKTRLYDVDRILSQAVAYLLLSAVLAGTYAGVVLLLGQGVGGVAGSSTIAVAVATLAVASIARPAHRTLQDTIDRRFSRRRYDALRMLRAHVASPDPSTTVEQVLRDALRDQDLAVSYWVPDKQVWVTGEGRPALTPARALTVRRGGRTVARVSSVALEAELVDAALREAEPELDNAGLRAAVALQLEDVRASRQRLATAQLDERRRVERDLHDGAQQRLLALAAQFQAALINGQPERLREALTIGVEQSQTAVRELRELANGLHPSVLADGGLAAALDDLAARHRVQIDVAEPDQRYSPRIEATAWFIACEAVTNAVKHAAADQIVVRVDRDGDHLIVVVEDDGLGGADPSGSGLRGLADRAEAVGGHLAVLARRPTGTTLRAVLPCGS